MDDMFNGFPVLAGALVLALFAPEFSSAAAADEVQPGTAQELQSAETQAYLAKLRALKWVTGPTTVEVVGDSRLDVPEGYVFLDQAETTKYLEMNQNLSDGSEMMIGPKSLAWVAYFSFAGEGYVKDDEKIDAAALLKTMQANTDASNAERRKRGWGELHLSGWAAPPAYNATTKRLEWATRLQSPGGESVNFFTKVLGRKGHTTVIMVTEPDGLAVAQPALAKMLGGYDFKSGNRYAEFVPGDKVAEYGLAALVLGGAAAVATKKGLWAIMATFLATSWKFLAAALVGGGAWLRKLFARKTA
jgi:uncharacterized membrane-anchored protein